MRNIKIKVPKSAKGKLLLEYLSGEGIAIHTDCGGRGFCKKCSFKILEGEFALADGSLLVPDENGYALACKTFCTDTDSLIEIMADNEFVSPTLFENADKEAKFGIALDIGTTTLCARLVDIDSGAICGEYSTLNPQKIYGSDCISRISACENGKLYELNKLIIDATNEIIDYFIKGMDIPKIEKLTVCANTTMLHIFANESPVGIGKYPFTPVFLEAREYEGEDLSLNAEKVVLLPSASAYIGSDFVAGILECGMLEKDEKSVIIDLGTNGEIAIFDGENLMTSSTAAGPCFEGGNISCGLGATSGAISEIKIKDGEIEFVTIGNAEPLGLCGSGLIDGIAYMLDNELIDETGRLTDEEFTFSPNVQLIAKDIREFQLAKSAICAGIITLIKECHLQSGDISTLYIAGALGEHLNIENAVRVGLIPSELKEKIKIVGNTSLKVAINALINLEYEEKMTLVSRKCQNIDLNNSPIFNDEFMNNMFF